MQSALKLTNVDIKDKCRIIYRDLTNNVKGIS